MVKNLWGEIEEIEAKTPYNILMEQASIIKDKTRGLLFAHVERKANEQPIYIKHGSIKYERACLLGLYVIVPILNNYRYMVANVVHDMAEPYPAYIENESGKHVECHDENSFEENLGKVLSSPRVKRAISGLLNQVRAKEKG